MKRNQLNEVKEWYYRKNRKPLIVHGARQVGKTYLILNLFAKNKELFPDYVYIDLKKDDEASSYFYSTCDATKYLRYIEARFNKKISTNVPLIIDEVQECPNVLTSLKYFKQDYPELPVIVTGSLVRLALKHKKNNDDNFLFPVGAIDQIDVFPLTFDEFLLNYNETLLNRIKTAYKNKEPLEAYEHEIAMESLYEFLSIGGLPEALNEYIESKSYVDTNRIIKNIYDNYLSDMDTYNVSSETILKTRKIYQNIYSQLDKENRNFKISQIDNGKSNRDYQNAYLWLELARVVYRSVKKQGKITAPLIDNEDGNFRLYLSDPGMFIYQSKVNQSNFFIKDKRNTLSGIFYENYVADELVAKGIPLYFWVGKQTFEFEFLVQNQGKILPIDVKKQHGKLNSLKGFRETNSKSTAIKISSDNFGYDSTNDILTLPLYETFLLAEDIKENRPII